MRYHEIVSEAASLERVMNANRKKSEAARKYQDKLRSIHQTAPPGLVADREQSARAEYQDRLASADDAVRRALASGDQ
ncbi:MAG: hypothetical protein KIS90_02440 [Phenylobacterium sp.]|nr:hypothetical protein [Phenylobacterium sp.]MCW5758615.1 hypothetical protein [Phenylobacterium sp.]